MGKIPPARPFGIRLWILLLVLMGLGALGGGGALLLAPDGSLLQMPASVLSGTPFHDYLVPGALLFTFLGVYPMLAAYGLYRRPAWTWAESLNPLTGTHWSWAGGVAAGIIVMVWITVQILLIGYLHPIQPFYFVWGVVIAAMGALPGVRRHCSSGRP